MIDSKTTILGLFSFPKRSFFIPSYQRAYSWDNYSKEKKNLETFLNDLKEQSSLGKPYYLGHFLFEKVENEEKYGIIDGQQRLTTVVIFFSSLLGILEKRSDLPDEFYLSDEKGYYLEKGSVVKLNTVDYDRPFFRKYIINQNELEESPDTSSQKRIIDAYNYFKKELNGLITSELLSLKEVLENSGVTTYVVDDKKQAAQIFEFQNDRGKDLTNLERLKSIFIYRTYLGSTNEIDDIIEIENHFRKIYEQTERINIHEDEVLNYYCRGFYFGYSHDNIVTEIKKNIKDETDVVTWIKDFCDGLRLAFKDIEKIQKNSNQYLKDLFYLDRMALCYPFLLKGCKYIDIDKDEIKFEKLVRLLEKIVFRVKLIGSRADIESRLNPYLKSFKGDVDSLVEGISEKLTSDWWWGYWNDNKVKEVINSNWFYNNPVDNYLLWKYEGSLKAKGYSNISFESVEREEIEHISPRTPTEGDPIANGYDDYDEEFIEKYLNCIGNLMLISKYNNCELGNKPFNIKLNSYNDKAALSQHLEIQDFISDPIKPVWDRESIKNRKEKILKFSLTYWKIT